MEDLATEGQKPMSKDEFLDQFPKNVIKKGKVVPIREELEKKFRETKQLDLSKLNSNEPIEIDTHVVEQERAGTQFATEDLVMLRVRTETGKRTLILKMLASDLIAAVYTYVRPYAEEPKRKFNVRSNFPRRAIEEGDAQSLKELGLFPSSALVLQQIN